MNETVPSTPTPSAPAPAPSSSLDHEATPQMSSATPQSIQTRRESNRKIKKPKYDLDDTLNPSASAIPADLTNDSSLATPTTSTGGAQPRPLNAANLYQLKYCNQLLKELFSKRHLEYAWPFYKPVDVKGLGLVDYFEIIREPMDMGSVRAKLEGREYSSPGEFAADMRLIFTNCYKYNAPDSDVVFMAKKLEEAFEIRFAKMPPPPTAQTPHTPLTINTNVTSKSAANNNNNVNSSNLLLSGNSGLAGKRRDSSQSNNTNKSTVSPSAHSLNNLTPNSSGARSTSRSANKQQLQLQQQQQQQQQTPVAKLNKKKKPAASKTPKTPAEVNSNENSGAESEMEEEEEGAELAQSDNERENGNSSAGGDESEDESDEEDEEDEDDDDDDDDDSDDDSDYERQMRELQEQLTKINEQLALLTQKKQKKKSKKKAKKQAAKSKKGAQTNRLG